MSSARLDRRERMAQQTRREILETARKLFAERGYVATSVSDIAEEAGVAVQTIYARLGSKHGLLMGLLDLIDEEGNVSEGAGAVATASTAAAALKAEIRLTRVLQQQCGDIIRALLTAAAVEPGLEHAVAEGQRRHRDGASLTIKRINELSGLREGLPAARAAALLSAATSHYAWSELVDASSLSWSQAEQTLSDALARAILEPH
jgi:AcrR family transcriptional regulator